MASEEVISCPNTPNELESVTDEDETLVSHEDETVASHEDDTVASSHEDGPSHKDEQREEKADEEWENISEKEVREACIEGDDVVASKSTETDSDELLVSSSSKTRVHSLVLTIH